MPDQVRLALDCDRKQSVRVVSRGRRGGPGQRDRPAATASPLGLFWGGGRGRSNGRGLGGSGASVLAPGFVESRGRLFEVVAGPGQESS